MYCLLHLYIGWGKDKTPSTATSATAIAGEEENLKVFIQTEPLSTSSCVLFVGGLPAVYLSEELKSCLQDLLGSDSKSIKVIKTVVGKSYVFIEMSTHDAARSLVQIALQSPPIQFQNKTLLLGWSKSDTLSDTHITANNNMSSSTEYHHKTIVEAPSQDCKTLFVGNLNTHIAEADLLTYFAQLSHAHHITLHRVQVFKPQGRAYAFVEFYSYAEASDVIRAYFTSIATTDNTTTTPAVAVDVTSGGSEQIIKGSSIKLGWAKGYSPDHKTITNEDTHNNECWFCLASATIKTHLIISIGEHVYVAMPRGALTSEHVLIIPIECHSSRIMFAEATKLEFLKYMTVLKRYFYEQHDSYCLVFERTLRTRGKDHMQTHMISLSRQQCEVCLQTFLQLANKYDVRFTEIEVRICITAMSSIH